MTDTSFSLGWSLPFVEVDEASQII